MGFLSRLSFISLQFFIVLVVGIGATKGLQYLASERYSPGDVPHDWFRVAVVEGIEANDKKSTYGLYPWRQLEEIRGRSPAPSFWLDKPAISFMDPDGEHVSLTVLAEKDHEQVVEVKRVNDSYETVNRYRVSREEIIPLYFRRTSTGIAGRGLIIGFLVSCLTFFPLRRMFFSREAPPPPAEKQG